MLGRPAFDRWDWAILVSAVGVLVFSYVIYPDQVVQYGAWLVVFTLWMTWFVYYGVKWLSRLEDVE